MKNRDEETSVELRYCPGDHLFRRYQNTFYITDTVEHIYIFVRLSLSIIFVRLFSPGLLLQQHGLVLGHHGLLGQELGALLAPLQRLLGDPGLLLVGADPLLQGALLVLRLLSQLLLARQLAPLDLTPQLLLFGLANKMRALPILTNQRPAPT